MSSGGTEIWLHQFTQHEIRPFAEWAHDVISGAQKTIVGTCQAPFHAGFTKAGAHNDEIAFFRNLSP